MPTVLSHPAVPIAIGLGLGRKVIPIRLLMAGIMITIVPDLDVLAFGFGIPYASDFGHRGSRHSLLFAVVLARLSACLFRGDYKKASWFLIAAAGSIDKT